MTSTRTSTHCAWGLISLVLILLWGCQHPEGTLTNPAEGAVPKRIAVIPFQVLTEEESALRGNRFPLSVSRFQLDLPPESPAKVVEHLFLEHLKGYKKFEIIYPDRAGSSFLRNAAASLKITTPEVLRMVGTEYRADAVIVGYVYRFRERKGLPYSVEKPASVAFDIHLLRSSDGALLWRGNFDQTQTSLMEDMLQIAFFFKEHGRWVTAEQLAEAGVEKVLKTFPGLP